jgi:hypothetical protein
MMLEYATYNGDDYYNFMMNYNYLYILYPVDDLYDFDKVGINSGGASHRNVNPTLNNFWMKKNGDNSIIIILLLFFSLFLIV